MPLQKNTNPVALARVRAGLTQVELALRSKKSVATVRLAESGISTITTLARLATALGVDVDELTGRRPTLPGTGPERLG